jgi:DNA polymerase-3 subunit epsilon
VGFDTETTGVDPAHDRIVTAAVVVRHPGVHTDVRTWLVDPGVEIPASASEIHGITTAHARALGAQPSLALEEIAALLAQGLRAGQPLVAFNAAYDLTLLDAELARHGLATLGERLGGPIRPVLDPLVIDRWLDRFRRGKRRLGDLVAFYGAEAVDELHSADVDVLATLDVLEAQVRAYPDLAAMDLADLHNAQVRAHAQWATGFNQWRASRGLDGPGASVAWPVEADGAEIKLGSFASQGGGSP